MTNTEAITKLTNIMHDDHYAWHPSILEAFRMAVDALRGAGGDCISRKEAIDICNNAIDLWHGQLGEGALVAVKKGIEGLPSAQPSFPQPHEKDHIAEVSKMDCISRQAAIDAIDVLCQEYRYKIPGKRETYSTYNEAWQDALDRAEGAIFNLPSAQTEIIRCKDCKHWTQSMGKMKGYGLGRCDFHDTDLVTCNGYCYWAERRTDG